MQKAIRIVLLPLLASASLLAQGAGKSVLIDHTHHEEGGTSAEWVICTGHEPDPSPANPTKETDWNGGMSALGFDLYKQGYKVQTLPASGGRITYGDSSNAQDLSKYNVFFIPECYTYFTAAEKAAIVKFVQNGGGLFLLGNHQGASRVASTVPGSTDAFSVFNDLATNNGVANNGFGFTWIVGHGPGDANANTTSTAYSTATNAATTAIIRGPNGTLSMQDFHSFSYLSINTANNPSAQGILSTQVSGDPSSDYFIATSTLGSGRIVATGDSSPADDGTTTTPGKSLHSSYTVNSNRAFFLNAIQYLASGNAAPQPPVVSISSPSANTTINAGSALTFQASATDPAGSSMTYSWVFGDGGTSTSLGPVSHTYTSAGTFAATFTATNAQHLSSSASRVITVNPVGNTVTASLTTPSGNVTVNSGSSVAFAGSGTDSSSSATLSYRWNFGDGATATGASTSHVYTNTGSSSVSYTAVFTVTDNTGASGSATRKITVNPATTGGSSFSENFESGSKGSYATGTVSLTSGTWTLNDALLGTSSSDPKNGSQSVRVRNSGKVTMDFNFATGAKTVSVKHGIFGSDSSATWGLWYSTNSGSTWTQAGSSVTTTSSSLQTATFTVNVSGPIRFEIRKTDGSSQRVNFDDFQIAGY
jgi:PKD repeat protein